MSLWKDTMYNKALQFWRATSFWKDLEEYLPADQIKCFTEVDRGDVQRQLLFSALLLELS